jgi:sarcosine oxidase
MKSPSASYDVAIIGLGAMGAAALYQLAKRGVRAVGIDRYTPPHSYGSSHGETRITRQAVGEGYHYVPLVLRSHEIWRELEAEAGETLLTQNGGLIVASSKESSRESVCAAFLLRTQDAARHFNIPHEMLGAAEIRYRYPQFLVQDEEIGYFEPGAGYLNPERCIGVQLERAQALGAVTRFGTRVTGIQPNGAGVKVKTDRGDIHAGSIIVSAGPWTPDLLGPPFSWILAPSRQILHWFPTMEAQAASWAESPVFVWSHGPKHRHFFYGFPALNGSNVVKTAGEHFDLLTKADDVDRTVDPAESREMYDKHLKGRLDGLWPIAVKAVTGLYTVTPDSDFLIDHHPDSDRILVVSPCSGHGFKHSAAIGEAAAQIAVEGRSRIDLSAFKLSRFDKANLWQPSSNQDNKAEQAH